MSIEVVRLGIEGLLEIQPDVHSDTRGFFFEQYSSEKYKNIGIDADFVQDNISESYKNVLRGMHFQTKFPQGKLITVLDGAIYDVAVDIRPESKTYLKYCGVILDSQKHNQFYIPERFAHGFLVLSDKALVSYKCTNFYHPECESGYLWNDSKLNINWADYLNGNTPILNDKDKLYAPLK